MQFTQLTVLLPCHSLEDFPVYHEGAPADELLAAWCALWHPALVASAQCLPNWHRIDVLPEALSGSLITVAPFCLDRLPGGFLARASNEGAWVVHEKDRDAALAAALSGLDGGNAGVDDPLAADFLALGFCRLQVELLTRQMRYSMHLDETHFQDQAVAAARCAVAHDVETARTHLQQCFDALYESRKHFYPVDVFLLDVTLAAENTPGDRLRAELAEGTPTNLLAPMAVLRTMSSDAAAWSELLAAIDAGIACVLGGETVEHELPLLPLETALAYLREGVADYETLLGRRPVVYGRRRAGLWPALPQLLTKLAYQGALHCTLDDGRFPLGPQSKTRWEGLDSSVVDVLARVPCNAARSETFLGLSQKLADSMDTDHVATLALAHWPGAVSPWYQDLRRIAKLSPVLGKFMLLDDYFSHTDMPGRLSKFEPDEYRTPYLRQAIIRRQSDPISRFVRAHRSQAARAAAESLATLHDLVVGCTDAAAHGCHACEPPEAAERADGDPTVWVAKLAGILPRAGSLSSPRYLIANPLSFARSVGIELAQTESAPDTKPATGSKTPTAHRSFAVVEVPAMGFAWVDAASVPTPTSRAKDIAHDNVLANEFFQVTISRTSGGIQSLYSFQQRGNQLSQQIARRHPPAALAPGAAWPSGQPEADYTTMQAESVDVTVASAVVGEIVSRGALLDADSRAVGRFRQTTRLWAGSRVLRIEIELDGLEELRADPWNAYYAARFAWPDETAQLWRGVSLARIKTDTTRLEAPEFIDIDNGAGTITILTGGLPYHRRSEQRMLDSLLVVNGESARRFSLAVGVDLPQPAAAALEHITPEVVWHESGPPAAAASGWFFHLGAKNIVATHWRPLFDGRSTREAASGSVERVQGFRARLLETSGQPGRVTLRAFREVASARQIDFLGQTLVELPVESDRIGLDFAAHEWIEVEAVWS